MSVNPSSPRPPVADRVDKLMSLTPLEFSASCSRLLGRDIPTGASAVAELPGGQAILTCQPQAGVTLGGLLALPRARVSIVFHGVIPEDRAAFLKRFELAFQRGGG